MAAIGLQNGVLNEWISWTWSDMADACGGGESRCGRGQATNPFMAVEWSIKVRLTHTHTHTSYTHARTEVTCDVCQAFSSTKLIVLDLILHWLWPFIDWLTYSVSWFNRLRHTVVAIFTSADQNFRIKFKKKFNLILKIEFKIKFLKSNFKLNKNDF